LLKTSLELSSGRNTKRPGSETVFVGLAPNQTAFKDDAAIVLFFAVNWKGYGRKQS
jgi:hypothetical protein